MLCALRPQWRQTARNLIKFGMFRNLIGRYYATLSNLAHIETRRRQYECWLASLICIFSGRLNAGR